MGSFKLLKITDLQSLSDDTVIPESDYSVTTPDGKFIQFAYIEETKQSPTYSVNPGTWKIVKTLQGYVLEKTSFVKDSILEEFTNTKKIEEAVSCFFSNLHLYKEFGIEVPKRGVLLYGPPGCHAKGTNILMYDGRLKKVEDVKVGDLLMGPDSKPRTVLELAKNKQEMVKIIPNKGDPFIVNKDHILHLSPSGESSIQSNINIKFSDFLNETECFKERFKLTRTGVEFEQKNLPIDPYVLGLWLGDGNSDSIALTTADEEIEKIWLNFAKNNNLDSKSYMGQSNSRCKTIKLSSFEKTKGKNNILNTFNELEIINNKHIPHIYLTSSRKQRLQLLAGLIDTDGTTGHSDIAISKGKFGTGYSYVSKLEVLADNVVYLARSLGFAAYKSKQTKGCYVGKKRVFEGEYFYVSISGNLEEVPVVLDRKKCKERIMNKDVLRTGFTYEMLPEDNYFGFSLNGDHLYLTGDFTIHHNTGKSTAISKCIEQYTKDQKTAVIVWHSAKMEAYEVKDFISTFEYKGVEKVILVIEDLGGVENENMRIASDQSLLSLLDNQEKTFTIPIMIIATTNFPENFASNLTNRAGRFDDKIEVGYPDANARVALIKFFAKEWATQEAQDYVFSKKCEKLAPSQLRESYIRCRIHSKTLLETLKELTAESDLYEKAFSKKSGVGF